MASPMMMFTLLSTALVIVTVNGWSQRYHHQKHHQQQQQRGRQQEEVRSRSHTMMSLLSMTTLNDDTAPPDHKDFSSSLSSSSSSLLLSSRRDFFFQSTAAATAAAAAVVSSATTPSTAVAAAEDSDSNINVGGKVVYGDESIMSLKEHGTSSKPVQDDLMYGVSNKLADRICNYNRQFAEYAGYYRYTNFEDIVLESTKGPITFYDSVTGKPLFIAPIGRSAEEFVAESEKHGWPSFRDQEVVWDNVRVLRYSGETVSIDGTHLGHNIPDRNGNRYCINLVSIAGKPVQNMV